MSPSYWKRRKQRLLERSQKGVEARARKRLESPAPDYPEPIDYTKPVKRITVEDFRRNETHVLTLYISRRRVNQYRVEVDGKPWKEAIGYSRLTAGLRKAR